MASLLAEQLEFDFFAPPEHEKPKADKKPAVSTAIKDADILNYQLNRDGSRKLQDFGEDLHNTRKGRSLNRSTEPYKFIQGSPEELEKRLSSEPLDKIWPKSSILELHKDNPEAAACLWLVRSTLRGRRPAKDTYKFRRYLHTASAAIALHRQVINGELAPEAPTDAFDHFYEVGNKYKVLAHISTKYWPFIGAYSKTEEAARSFEAFVEVRSQELGITNDFLTNGAFVEKTLDKESYYPYLDGVDVRRVSEKFKALFEEIKSKETEKGVALFSKTRESKSGAKISEIREALEKKFGKTTIDALIDNGRLKIVSGINDVPPYLSALPEELKNSKKNTKTGFIVPDQLAHDGNPEGIFATLKLKENLHFPSGKVIVKEGFHIAYQHRGFGAKHLTGNLLEHPNRSLSVTQENKTEEALLSLKEVLGSASELFKVKEDQFVFYSNKYNRGVPCKLNDDGDLFAVITDRPVNVRGDRYKIWGNDSVRLSGALIFPDHTASVTAPSLVPAIEQNQNGTQPVKSHKGLYTDVDYTEELKNNLAQARSGEKRSFKKTPHFINSGEGRVQGFYEQEHKTAFLIAENLVPEAASSVLLHEVGIHMAYDSELKEKVIPLVKEAPRLLEEGFRQRDPVCMAAEIRLKDSGITKDHPNYAEETAAYLVEECSKQRNALPKLQRWYKQMRSTVSVWLVEHGFKDSKTLTTDDFVTIAKANIKALAEQKELTASQTKNEKILFSLNKQHRDTLELMRKELPNADPAMQNPKLLEKVLQAVEERMLESERQGKILKVNSEFFKRPTPASRTQTEQKIPEQNKTKGLER